MRFIPLIAIALALAACGTGTPARAAASPPADSQKALAAYVDCLRQHGLPANDNGTVTVTGGGPSQSDAQAALQACQSKRPGGTQRTAGAGNQASFEQLLRWAACMRQHGANVPDPTRDPSSGGIGINLPPGQDPQTLQAAQQACSSLRPTPGSAG